MKKLLITSLAAITREKADRHGYTFDYGIIRQGFIHLLETPIKRRSKQEKALDEVTSAMIREIKSRKVD